MSNLSPVQRQVLDRIASGESHSYQDLFGGHQFKSFATHPQIRVPLPNGQYTTAAGRYQITLPTWEEAAKRLGVKDFSPASQDEVAWDIAQRTYQQKTGRDLTADAQAGRADFSALGNQWTSLRGQKPTTGPTAVALSNPPAPLALPAPAGQLTPVPQLHPSHAIAALAAAVPGHQLEPVDYHPWDSPFLTPVDNDPFQKEADNGTAR